MKRIILHIIVFSIAWGQALNAQNSTEEKPIIIGHTLQLNSSSVDELRTISIYVPDTHSASSNTRYPVVYVLDGEAYFLHAVSTVRSLSGLGLMPEVIVVGIHNTNRERDMTPETISIPGVPAPGADRFLDFIQHELTPFIEGRYRTQPLRIVIGHSHGGLLSMYALAARPDLFRWHLVLDAPTFLEEGEPERFVEAFLAAYPDHVGRLASAWTRFEWSEQSWETISGSNYPDFIATRFDLVDESHQSMYFEGIYEGLRDLFYDFAYDNSKVLDVEALQARYETLSKQYGYHVPIPRQALQDFAEEHLFAGYPDRARPMIDKYLELYGESPRTQRLESWISDLTANPLPETSEVLLDSTPPAEAEITPFLGTWHGEMRSDAMITVKLGIDEGVVIGETVQTFFGGGKAVFEHDMMRITDESTLDWGYMNRMRPYSVLLAYRGTLNEAKDEMSVVSLKTVSMPPGMPADLNLEEFTLRRISDQ